MFYRQNVNKLYFIIFFHNLIPAYVIERLFWQERGMTVMMVVLCEIIYAITIVITEIPTGVLADKFSRKALLVVGGLLSMVEMIILLFAYSFWAFAFAVFLAGIAGACVSGAMNALLYDSLLVDKREKSFEKIIGKLNSIDFIGAILAALFGSVLAKMFNFEFNYILSASSMFIALIFTLFLREPPKDDMTPGENKSFKFNDYIMKSVSFFQQHPKIVSILIQSMAIAACVTYLDEFWQLYLHEIGFTVLFFGVFSALISLAKIPGNLIAGQLLHYFRVELLITTVLGITCIGFIVTAIFPGKIGLVMILVLFLASGVIDPIICGYVHHRTSTIIRATVESVQSLVERVITFSVGIGFGIISTRTSVVNGFLFLGVVTILFLMWFIKNKINFVNES